MTTEAWNIGIIIPGYLNRARNILILLKSVLLLKLDSKIYLNSMVNFLRFGLLFFFFNRINVSCCYKEKREFGEIRSAFCLCFSCIKCIFSFSDLAKRKWFNQFTVPETQLELVALQKAQEKSVLCPLRTSTPCLSLNNQAIKLYSSE